MKVWKRALSVGLSLALCAGLAAPGFAATFTELQDAIDNGTSYFKDGVTEETKSGIDENDYRIKTETSTDDEGNAVRNVTLYEDVEFDKDKDRIRYSKDDIDNKYGIIIGEAENVNVTLDLNGQDVDLNPEWTLKLPETTDDPGIDTTDPGTLVNVEAVYDPREDEYYQPGELEMDGISTGDYDNKAELYGINAGNVIKVGQGSSLTLKDTSESAKNGEAGKITGGVMGGFSSPHTYTHGAGIINDGTFVMDGGEISGNNDGTLGGVVNRGGSFTMNGGKITGNRSGLHNEPWGEAVTLNGGEIIGNVGYHGNGSLDNSYGKTDIRDNRTEGSETVYPNNDVRIDSNGKLVGASVTKTDNGDGTTTIKTDDGKGTTTKTTITVPKDENGEPKGEVTVDNKGTTTVPEGGKITDKVGTETTYPDGAEIDKDGNVTTEGGTVTKTGNEDGTTSIKTDDGKGTTTETTVTVPDGKDATVGGDGTTTVPEGSKITDGDGSETTYPDGAIIDKDGNVTTEGGTVTKDGETGDVTITGKDENGNETETKVDVPEDKKDGVDVDSEGKTHVPGGSEQPVEVKKDGEEKGTEITAPEGKDIVVNPDGSVDVPEGGKVTDKDGNEYELPEGGKVTEDGKVVDKDGNPVAPKKDDSDKDNDNGGNGGSAGSTGGAADVVTIEGVEVPLAGIVTVEDVLEVLYRLAEDAEGETARDEVIAWAIENGIIDDEADAEEIVTVAILRDMLANYARAFELDVDVYALAALVGEDDDIVMNCDEVIGEFFAQDEEEDA